MPHIRVRNTINVIHKKVVDVYFASQTEETIFEIEKGKKVTFTKLNKATLGEEVYIIVKTENLGGVEIEINVMQGREKVLVEKDRAISLLKDDKKKLKAVVGEYTKNDKITNKDDFKDWAIAKITLAPKEEKTLKTYTAALKDATGKKTYLFLAVHACTAIDGQTEFYKDGKIKKTSNPNYYLNEEGKWLEFINEDPLWMLSAKNELGEKEISGKKANKQILAYFKASKFWGTDDSGGENAWCGSFVSWVMKKHNYSPPSNAFRAKEWKKFGKVITTPVYGAIGVKSRKGGGHVAFIVGKSKDDKYQQFSFCKN